MLTGRIIYNPIAGQHSTLDKVKRAASVFESNGWRIDIVTSQSGIHAEQIASETANEGLEALFVVGGDGSISQAAAGLIGRKTALGILPAGTSNVWARDLNMARLSRRFPDALESSALALVQGRIQYMDYARFGNEKFLFWAGIGFDGVVVNQIEKRRKGRRFFTIPKYIAALVRESKNWDGIELKLTVDGYTIAGRYYLIVIANIPSYAGGLVKISPHACVDDGKMDLWLFSGKNAFQLAGLLLSGRHVNSKFVECISFRSLKISANTILECQLDGEPIKYGENLEINVVSNSLKVLVPNNTPAPLFSQVGRNLVENA